MECEAIRQVLSEYLDDVLDGKTRGLVDEHLRSCPACRSEFASLQELVNQVSSIKPVEPPKDFLVQLHERMERRSGISGMFTWLFYPLRIKIPLQFAGAALVAVFVFFVVRVQEPVYKFTDVPSSDSSKQEQVVQKNGDKEKEESRRTRIAGRLEKATPPQSPAKKRVADQAMPKEQVSAGADKGQELKMEKPEASSGIASAPAPAPKMVPIEISLLLQKDAKPKPATPGKYAETRQSSENEMQRTVAPPKPATLMLKEKDQHETLPLLEEIIKSFDGKIIAARTRDAAEKSGLIDAEIPAGNLAPLIEKLKLLGEIQSMPELPSDLKDQEKVPLRINLLPRP